jgi:hypothetical protein
MSARLIAFLTAVPDKQIEPHEAGRVKLAD